MYGNEVVLLRMAMYIVYTVHAIHKLKFLQTWTGALYIMRLETLLSSHFWILGFHAKDQCNLQNKIGSVQKGFLHG